MRFEFTDDQRLFQTAVREFLTNECPPDAVRAAWDDPLGYSPQRWQALAEMGVVGLMIPEEHGGMGMNELDLVLLLEECGRVALPEPVVDTAAVGGPLLTDAADSEVQAEWQPRIAAGEAIVAVQKGGRAYITDAHIADTVILVHDDEVHAVPAAQLDLVPQKSVDGSRRLFRVDWHRHSDTLIASGEEGWRTLNRAFDRGVLATSAMLVGLADRMLEMTVEYAKEREQFGVPIGSFQAIKHHLSNALLQVEFARPVVYRAAYSMAHGLAERSRDVSMAKIYSAGAAHEVAAIALQVHGAIGYTVEADLHLFMKRAWALEAEWGAVGWHRERVATAVLGPRQSEDGAAVDPAPLGESLG